MMRVLVTGATGQIGREVVAQLRDMDCRIRALSRTPESARLPPGIDVVGGDLLAPDSLDAALDEVDAVFLVWLGPLAAAVAAVERIAARAARIVLLTSPHRTPSSSSRTRCDRSTPAWSS
jgi:uncharacterized protein YbjT (DUF2867 family)